MRPRPPALAAVALAVLGLAGCGEGPMTTVRGHTIRVTLDEYRIVPQRLSVGAGRLRFVVRNDGRLIHDLQIATTARTDASGDPLPIARTHGLYPGQSATLTVRLAPGAYRLSCTLLHHDQLGQHGSLRVVARRS